MTAQNKLVIVQSQHSLAKAGQEPSTRQAKFFCAHAGARLSSCIR